MDPRTRLKNARARVTQLKSLTRDFTPDELTEVNQLIKEIPDLEAKVARMDRTGTILNGLKEGQDTDLEPDDDDGLPGLNRKGYLRLKGNTALVRRLAKAMLRDTGTGTKALMPAGQTAAGVEVTQTSPVSEGRPAAGLLDVVPVLPNTSARFEFLRQTTRDLNAAPVAPGGTKPTSALGIERVPGELKVVAHLSEPIDKYMLEDFAALEQFVAAELIFGLVQAVEGQLLAGDGTGQNLEGILSTTGVLQQAFATDPLTTARKAITRLEEQGLEPTGFVFSPADWETIELSRTSGSGQLEVLDSPVNRAARQLYGVPVAVSAGLTDGQGVLVSRDSVSLRTDAGIAVAWSENVGTDFQTNQVRARCEVRAAVEATRPGGIVVIDTVATP